MIKLSLVLVLVLLISGLFAADVFIPERAE